MPYLIDGYNLLHALGVLHGPVGPKDLERARRRLLGLLRRAHRESDDVTVVFDAAHAGRGAAAETEFDGIHVRFAVAHDQADDLIEEIIRTTSTPKQLVVVSDDRRLQRAARRRHCSARGCLDYLEDLKRKRQAPAQGKPHAEKHNGSLLETEHWLAEFGD